MSGSTFGSFPNWWVTKDSLLKSKFRASAEVGVSIAALKCLLLLSVTIDFHSRSCRITYDEFERGTGLSRPMVSKGLKYLVELGILLSDGKYRPLYRLKKDPKKRSSAWSKVPILIRSVLPSFPNRGVASLHALKLYLQLLSDRNNKSPHIQMSYDRIEQKVGIQRRNIKKCISLLVNSDLVYVNREYLNDGYSANKYQIRGILTVESESEN